MGHISRSTIVAVHVLLQIYSISSFTSPSRPSSNGYTSIRTPTAPNRNAPFQLSMTDLSETTWKWHGHDVYTQISSPSATSETQTETADNDRPQVLLIHGFGCSTTYWRRTISSLVGDGYTVHALDLLGQGKSAKPGRSEGIEISIDLWAEIVDDYAKENMNGQDCVLGGNSLGSLVALSAAAGDFTKNDDGGYLSRENRVKGLLMFNCGVGLNSRNVAEEPMIKDVPLQRFFISEFLSLLDILIFKNYGLLKYILTTVVTQELLGNVLKNLYRVHPEYVDTELVDSFYYPAKDAGSVEALSQIYTNDPGRSPAEIHGDYDGTTLKQVPIHLIWGDEDTVTPLAGGAGQFYTKRAEDWERMHKSGAWKQTKSDERELMATMSVIPGGHVPFDDNPEEANVSMLKWMKEVILP